MRLLALCWILLAGLGGTPDPKLFKAFDAWLRAYRTGKLNLASNADIEKESIVKRHGLMPKGLLGKFTAQRELEVLLDAAVEEGSAESARRVLAVASVGLDKGSYTRAMAPMFVRSLGEQALAKFKDSAARELLLAVAGGEPAKLGNKELDKAAVAAALRALGTFGDLGYRKVLEDGLRSSDAVTRLAAAEGLRAQGDRQSFDALARALEAESSEPVIQSLVASLEALLARDDKAFSDDQRRHAVKLAVQALGRGGWRSDLSLIGFLEKFRNAEAIPALIDVLERFVLHPDQVRSGQLSGILRHRAHEVLVSLSGAIFPIDAIDQWRAFWAKEKDSFKVPEAPKAQAGTVSSGFFGVPVQGTRVLFIVDVSGSMLQPMPVGGTTGGAIPDEVPIRLDVAKRELLRAVDQLPEESSFNIVTFSNGAKLWQKDLVPANKKSKEAFRKFVEELRADGGTNLWGGMQEALKVKALTYGDRYESHADEVFILSDGLPSVGEVIDPKEILRLIAETNRFAQMRINTVYISGEPDQRERRQAQEAGMTGQELMKAIATQNGGRHVERRNADG
jgi:hypothetical protein